MPAYQAGAARVSSTVTKRNPRPRKYASASERQAAYRARAPEVCFRAEAKTVETLDQIAETLDQPRADVLLSMTKFALANHDWARFGLTHKPLPYGYGLAEQEFVGPRLSNPSAYSDPALWEHSKQMAVERLGGHSARAMQLAGKIYRAAGGKYLGKRTKAQKSLEQWTAQDWTTKSGKPSRETGERYLPREVIEGLTPAEYGATTRAKRKGTAAGQQFVKQPKRIAAKVAALKANPTMKKLPVLSFDGDVVGYAGINAHKQAMALSGGESIKQELKVVDGIKRLVWVPIKRKENPTMKKPTPAQLAARARFAEMARSGAFKRKAKRKTNPAGVSEAKTVRELKTVKQMREWFGSLTDALTDAEVQYMKSQFITLGYGDFVPGQIPTNVFYRAQIDATRLHPTVKRKTNPAKKTVSQKISQLVREGYPQKQAVAIALEEQRRGKVKANPARRGRAPSIQVGDYVRSYDFPGMHDDYYLEGVVTKIGNGVYVIDVSRRIVGGEEKSIPASLRQVQAPMAPHFMTGVYGVQKLTRMDNPRAANPATGTKKSRTKLNPKPRTAKIAWLTPGGQREVMEVPIDFAFKEYIGNIQEDFFARTDGGFLVVTEKSTGMKVGQVPHTMRAAALNDKAAAKQFVQSIAEKVGAPAFRAAIAKHPRIA